MADNNDKDDDFKAAEVVEQEEIDK